MEQILKVLIVEDSEDDALLILCELKQGWPSTDYKVVNTKESYINELKNGSWDVILCDYNMPAFTGFDAIKEYKNLGLDIPFFFVSGAVSEEDIVQAMKIGAHDYLMKDKLLRLVPAIKRELKEAQVRFERNIAREDLYKLNQDLEERVRQRTEELRLINAQLVDQIAQRELLESNLISTQHFLNIILENIPLMIFVKNIENRKITYINKAAENAIGVIKGNLLGHTFSEMVQIEDLASIEHKEDELISGKIDHIFFEKKITREDNTHIVLGTYKILLHDENGNATSILGIAENITEKKESEKLLRKSENRFSKIFHTSPMAIIVWSMNNGKIIDFNNNFLKLFDFASIDIDLSIYELGIFESDAVIEGFHEELLANGPILNKEIVLNYGSESSITTLLSMDILKNEDDDQVICIVFDISSRKAAEEFVAQSLEKQIELNMLKTQFISMISHEFRTPLTTIMLSADLLKRYGNSWSSEEKYKHYQRIQETILRMTQLMENVLIIGRMDSGALEFNPDHIDLRSFAKSIAKNIEFNAAGRNKINFSFNTDIYIQLVDENLLGLTISNLLTNAVKYSPQGATIDFSIDCDENYAVFTITDYGIGIPSEDLAHLFQAFFRANNVGPVSGYGLGLSIVKKCIEAHHGLITVESKENAGTTFKVTIPVNKALYGKEIHHQVLL